jgi:hypothetical protein
VAGAVGRLSRRYEVEGARDGGLAGRESCGVSVEIVGLIDYRSVLWEVSGRVVAGGYD